MGVAYNEMTALQSEAVLSVPMSRHLRSAKNLSAQRQKHSTLYTRDMLL